MQLCREFMASDKRISWDMPLVLGRSVCRKCGFNVSGKACGDSNGCFNEGESDTLRDANKNIFATCSKGHAESKTKTYPTPHDFVGTRTTLRALFPYPSLYSRISATEALHFGENYMEKSSPSSKTKSKDAANARPLLANGNKLVSGESSTGSYREDRFDLNLLTDILEGDEEGSEKESTASKGGANVNGRKPSSVKSSMTHSLKTTIDFMRQVREERHELDNSGLSGLSDLPGTLNHLTARTLRMSSRLKPSQRREKLMRLATEVTAMESHLKHAHPIRYGAAVLFSDGTVAIASQKVALEYGCTLDAVGQLASTIDRKAIQIEEDSPACRPILLVQCDQFGVCHAPFARGRAFLTERGYGDCKVLIHQNKKKKGNETINEDEEQEFNESFGNGTLKGEDDGNTALRLVEVEANDLGEMVFFCPASILCF